MKVIIEVPPEKEERWFIIEIPIIYQLLGAFGADYSLETTGWKKKTAEVKEEPPSVCQHCKHFDKETTVYFTPGLKHNLCTYNTVVEDEESFAVGISSGSYIMANSKACQHFEFDMDRVFEE